MQQRRKHLVPDRYTTSSAPLSQPESRAVDTLFEQYRFDASVSIHAFGGYIYYPWAGRYYRAEDWKEMHHLAEIMKQAQAGKHPYKVMSHWMFYLGHKEQNSITFMANMVLVPF